MKINSAEHGIIPSILCKIFLNKSILFVKSNFCTLSWACCSWPIHIVHNGQAYYCSVLSWTIVHDLICIIGFKVYGTLRQNLVSLNSNTAIKSNANLHLLLSYWREAFGQL